MKLQLKSGIALAGLGMALVACAPTSPQPDPTVPPLDSETDTPETEEPLATMTATGTPEGYPGAAADPDATPGEAPTGLPQGAVPKKFFDIVLNDLLARTGAEQSELVVIQSESLVWPDGSLGCPAPGMVYTQALVNGYRVIFGLGDETFDYHLSDGGEFVLCEIPLPDSGYIGPPIK